MRGNFLWALLYCAGAFAISSARAAEPPDRELIELSPTDAGSADAPAELPPNVAKACADAGFIGGSAEQRRCGLELIPILRSRRGRGQKANAPSARVLPGFNLGNACARYFPTASRREREEGMVTLLVYVGADHRVKEVIRWESSGFDRLDVASAQCMYKEARFQPKLVDGLPVGSWQQLRYTWRLR